MEIAANCHGVDVPQSPFLNETRIKRINAARYEGQEIAGALNVVHAGDKVLELGAGLGVVGAVTAANCKPARVVSFEGNPNLIPHIQALYDLNGLGDVITVRNQVLISAPDRPDHLPFQLHNSFLGSSLQRDPASARETVQVPTASYAELKAELDPDILLMDIEGGELEFLEHADLSGIRSVVVEFHPGVYDVAGMRRCKSILRDAGFANDPDLSNRTVWVASRA